MKNDISKSKSHELRHKAESLLKKKTSNETDDFSEADTLKLIHELEVHQLELEMQNDELMKAKAAEKKAADKYTTLYDFAPTGYFTFSRDGKILDLNLMGARMLGKERANLKNRRFSLYIFNGAKKIFDQFLENIFKSNIKESCEIPLLSDGKNQLYILLTGIAADTGDQCFVTAVDITERKQVEKLIKEKEYAEESDRLKTAFLTNMSHEIRTPMNAIVGFAEYLSKPGLPAAKKERFAKIIKDRSYDLMRLIDDILDVSKIEVGQLKFYKSEFSLYELMNEFYDEYTQKIKDNETKSNIKLKLMVSEEMRNVTIFTDYQRLKQVITNLLDNALKFTHQGSIEFGYNSGTGSAVVFYIRDTGIGIPADKQEIIFDRFRQADESMATRLYGGTGLGLAIVKGIVKLMDGKIWLESKENMGTSFYFSVPLVAKEVKKAELFEMPAQ